MNLCPSIPQVSNLKADTWVCLSHPLGYRQLWVLLLLFWLLSSFRLILMDARHSSHLLSCRGVGCCVVESVKCHRRSLCWVCCCCFSAGWVAAALRPATCHKFHISASCHRRIPMAFAPLRSRASTMIPPHWTARCTLLGHAT